MRTAELLTEAFGRIQGVVHSAVKDAGLDTLTYRPDPDANSIAWLVWHLTRVQDDHLSDILDQDDVWISGGWYDSFALPFDPGVTGYVQSSAEVGQVRVGADLLTGYYDAVHARTVGYLATLGDDDLDRVVDESYDPPVTLGVRLVSMLADDLQHAGQASYVRGLARRAGR